MGDHPPGFLPVALQHCSLLHHRGRGLAVIARASSQNSR
jgi:hypothetical protein